MRKKLVLLRTGTKKKEHYKLGRRDNYGRGCTQEVNHPTKGFLKKEKKRKLRSGKYQSNMAKIFLSSKNKNLQIESVSFLPKKMNGTDPHQIRKLRCQSSEGKEMIIMGIIMVSKRKKKISLTRHQED